MQDESLKLMLSRLLSLLQNAGINKLAWKSKCSSKHKRKGSHRLRGRKIDQMDTYA